MRYRIISFCLALAAVIGLAVWGLHGAHFAVLDARGPIAEQQRGLLVFGVLLSAIVVIPVFTLLALIGWRYRASNETADYRPDWDHNRAIELVWWLIPIVLIGILSVVAWVSSHRLDPARPLASSQPPLTIQVVALDWKWLFIYPDQQLATVNFVQFPVGRPVNFQITADAPMNSFWIPQLGGQIYAMPGMSTQLHLQADSAGDYRGSSANISGRGFSGMTFIARASSTADFNRWVNRIKQTGTATLSNSAYAQLAAPSTDNPVTTYASVAPGLYATIVNKTMPTTHTPTPTMISMPSMVSQ